MLTPRQLDSFLDKFLSEQDPNFSLSKSPDRPAEPNLRVYDFFKPESPVVSDRELSERLHDFETQAFQYKALYLAYQVDLKRWREAEKEFLMSFKNQLLLANGFPIDHDLANKVYAHCFYEHDFTLYQDNVYGYLDVIANDFIYLLGSLLSY